MTNSPHRLGVIPRIERSRVDARWCVYTRHCEALVNSKGLVFVWLLLLVESLWLTARAAMKGAT